MLEGGQQLDYKTQCGEEMPHIGKVNLVARSLLLIKLSLNCLDFINHGHQLKIQQGDVSNISVLLPMLEAGQLLDYKAQCGEEMTHIGKVNLVAFD